MFNLKYCYSVQETSAAFAKIHLKKIASDKNQRNPPES